jgi:hypothetical protein
MRRMGVVAGILALMAGAAMGQGLMVIEDGDGPRGTVNNLGNGFRISSDAHRSVRTITDLGEGFQIFQSVSPDGQPQSGTTQRFGSVPQPITPAPVLPVSPRISPLLTPGEPKAPPVAPPSSGTLGTGFWKR